MVEIKIKRQFFPMLFFVLLCLYTISLFIPAIWTLMTSFKGKLEFLGNPFGLPKVWNFSNYTKVFKELYVSVTTSSGSYRNVYMYELFFNSVVYSLLSTVITTLSHCLTAYVVAKYNFKFGRVLYSTVIVTLILPIVGSLPAQLDLMRTIGFYDNMLGLVIAKASFTGTNFLIFYATFKGISWGYAEAAFIDGASHARVMFTIMIPLAKITVMALGLITFIAFWNDWQVSMIYMPNFPVVAYGLYNFQFNTTNGVTGLPFLMAACIWVMAPVLILFLLFRNKLMGAIAVGGLKG